MVAVQITEFFVLANSHVLLRPMRLGQRFLFCDPLPRLAQYFRWRRLYVSHSFSKTERDHLRHPARFQF